MAFNDFTGVPLGTQITTANSGGAGNTLLDLANSTAASNASMIGSNDFPVHNKNHLRINTDNVTSSTNQIGWNATTLGAITTQYVTAYFRFTGYPTATTTFIRITQGGTASILGTVGIRADGTLGMYQNGGAVRVEPGAVVDLNAWVRIQCSITGGNGTANTGTAELRYFNSADREFNFPTAVSSATAFNTSTFTLPDTVRVGQISALTGMPTFYIADLTVNGTGYAAPYQANDGWTYKRFIRIGT